MELKAHAWTPAEAAWEKIRPMIGAKAGLLRSIREIEAEPDDLSLYSYWGEMTRTAVFSPFKMPQDVGSGNFDRLRAKLAVVGEGLERYGLTAFDDSAFIKAPYSAVRDRAVDPRSLILFDQSQYTPDFHYPPFREDTVMQWVEGYNLTRQCPMLAPAGMVYLAYNALSPAESCSPSVSTGAAAASTLEEAILKGIYEVVERDSLTIMWLARLGVPRVKLGNRFPKLQEQLSCFNLELYVHSIMLDLDIPAFWGMLVNRDGQAPVLAVGAAASLNPEDALRKVVEEAIQTRMWAKSLAKSAGQYPDLSRPENFKLVTNFDLHVMLYAAYDMRYAVDFLLNSEKTIDMAEIPNHSSPCVLESIQRSVALLAERGFEVIAVDITPREIREAGLSVAKVIIPHMQPLNGNHNLMHLGNPRLYEVARKFGRELSFDQVNPYPHPFP